MSSIGGRGEGGGGPDGDAILRHELLTPLTGIVGIAELLLEKAEGKDRRYLEGLIAAARGMVPVIASIGGGQAGTAREGTADLGSMLRGMGGFAEARAMVRGLQATIAIEGDFPAVPRASLVALQHVLINLVDNAVKYTDRGAIAFRASCRPGRDGDRVLSVAVSDTGRGIAADDLERVRTPGMRGEGVDDRQGEGIGLGVAVAEIERLGGRLEIASEYGRGSDFTVTLPLAAPSAAPSAKAVAETGKGGSAVPPAARVLVADDNAINRKLIGEILGRLGYRIALAADGREALRLAAAHPFDAVVMDIEMPGLDGIETAGALKTLAGETATAPVIALTAHGRGGEKLRRAGGLFADVVAKPIDPAALDASLRLALASRHRRKASA